MLKDNIAGLRNAAGLSQTELAERLFVVRQTVSKWEKGLSVPDSDMLIRIAKVFDVTVGELLDEQRDDSQPSAIQDSVGSRFWKKIALAFFCFAAIISLIVTVVVMVNRSNILYPDVVGEDVNIVVKDSIQISRDYGDNVVYDVDGKPRVICRIPDGFVEDANQEGLYIDPKGNFIKIVAEYTADVLNPLDGTAYMEFYEIDGYSSYADMARLALFKDLGSISIFSPKRDIYTAGGARIIRQALCAGKDAWCYAVDGGLTKNGEGSRIYGAALLVDGSVWMALLEDCNNIHYWITVKAPDGIGKDEDSLAEFLSTIRISE